MVQPLMLGSQSNIQWNVIELQRNMKYAGSWIELENYTE